jgi:hypothetical protein
MLKEIRNVKRETSRPVATARMHSRLTLHVSRFTPHVSACTALFVVALLLTTGCASSRYRTKLGMGYAPDNVTASSPLLPAHVRRVAMLPLVCDDHNSDAIAGRDALSPVLYAELVKTEKFEVVTIEPELLRSRTGKSRWSAEEALPPDFLKFLRDAYACDAVFFSRLTVFRGYPPLAVGWRTRLVDVRNGEVLWAGDEVFDAGRPTVLNAAARYHTYELHSRIPGNGFVMAHSPRRFGQYSAAELLATLPDR